MKSKFPFRLFQPGFCSGLFDDPLLFLRIRPNSSNILVDCGQLNHLTKRLLKSIQTLFISHAHMDHFIGFDSFVRGVLVSNRTVEVIGPPGIAERLSHKLNAYDWNLIEDYYCSFKIHEVDRNTTQISYLDGSKRFRLKQEEITRRSNRVIIENSSMVAEAEICDHKIPVLIFKFTEKPIFSIDEYKLEKRGFVRGPWLNHLKNWVCHSGIDKDNAEMNSFFPENPQTLYDSIKKEVEGHSIGYITDVGLTESNLDVITRLMKNLTLLVCECTYLKEDKGKARQSYHLCTEDVKQLVSVLKPRYLLPMHLSKTYLQRSDEMYHQLETDCDCQLIRLPDRLTYPPQQPLELTRLIRLSENVVNRPGL